MHLVGMSTTLILLSLVPWSHTIHLCHNITILPLRRPLSSSVNPKPRTPSLGHVRVSSVVICHVIWSLRAQISFVPYVRIPSLDMPVKPWWSALIPFVTLRPLRTDVTYSWQPSRTINHPHKATRVFCAHFFLTRCESSRPLSDVLIINNNCLWTNSS
jgi:hypothetical protein